MSFQEKNGRYINEMEKAKMPEIKNTKVSNGGLNLHLEFVQFPVSFVNALRRILLSGIPTVVIRDVQILQNTTQMPHEMMKHRVEMLPVNVRPDDSATIKDAKIELLMPVIKEDKIITTDDFTINSGNPNLLMKDPEFDTPSLFLKVRAGETVHITGRLAVENDGVSQVSTASTGWKVDPELAKRERELYIKEHEDDKDAGRHFDNFLVKRHYYKDDKGRPYWHEMDIESVGVMESKELLRMAVNILKTRVNEYIAEALKNIKHEKDEGVYSISLDMGGHTVGSLLQSIIYYDPDVQFVSYDIPHPLKPTMVLRIASNKKTPEKILENVKKIVDEYCSVVENNNGSGV
jgi:hypothetical protein